MIVAAGSTNAEGLLPTDDDTTARRGSELRVLLATNSTDRGSTSRTLEGWLQPFREEGIHATVTVGGPGPLMSALQQAGFPVCVRPLRVLPRRHWPFPFANAVLRLAATARRARAHIVHVNEHDHHPVAAHAAAIAGLPLVTHLRFTVNDEYARWLFRRGRVPDRLLFTSLKQMRDSASAIEPVVPRDRWRLVSDGLDFSVWGSCAEEGRRLRQQWRLAEGTIAIGIACAISARKRVDHFVRLIARMHGAGIPVHGFVAGRPHFPSDAGILQNLEQLAATLGIQQHITFLGYVEPVEPLYHAWDICISTSAYETFGMSVLEAIACSRPVVTYPGGSIAEIVGDGAVVVGDADEQALFDRCVLLARDPVVRAELGAQGRRHAETYDIRRIARTLAREYRDVVGQRR